MRVQVKVSPQARQTAYCGYAADGRFRFRVAAVPENGKANKELLRYLAQQLGLPAQAFTIIAGAGKPLKTLEIAVDSEQWEAVFPKIQAP